MGRQETKLTEQELRGAQAYHLELAKVYERNGHLDACIAERIRADRLQEQIDGLPEVSR